VGEATREIFGNIPSSQHALFYLLALVSTTVFIVRTAVRVRRWMRGNGNWRLTNKNLSNRLRYFVKHGFGQPRLRREPSAGFSHLLIFWAFLILLIATTLIAIEYHTPLSFLHGVFYLFFSLATDIFGVFLLLGVGIAAYRRYVSRPQRLSAGGYGIPLFLLGLLGATGFVLEGFRIALFGSYRFDWSPGGAAVAALLKSGGFEAVTLSIWHYGIWWFHAVAAFTFIALLPGGRMRHTLAALLNIFFNDTIRPKGKLATPFRLAELESGVMTRAAPATPTDLSRMQLLSLDACTECGLCEAVCPASGAGRPLSPKQVIVEMRDHLDQRGKAAWRTPLEEIISPQESWSCTTCRACVSACPVSIQHIDLLIDVRRALVMKSRVEPNMASTLTKLQDTGNPFGLPAEQRLAWTAELPGGVRVEQVRAGGDFEVLFWVGCAGAFDDKGQRISRAVATVLSRAGVRFAVLGTEECCTGDPARRLGEEGLFQQLAQQNVKTLNKYGVNQIVTGCPHCFNTLKNEYPEFGGEYEILHHSEFIEGLIADGRLKIDLETHGRPLTYHDPCYLGRHNDVYDRPRNLLTATTGSSLREMPRSREQSFCCGAGGSNAWFEMRAGKRINDIRYDEAAETGAEVVVTACPFCITMFDEVAGGKEPCERMEIRDLAEIVEHASRR
jgi:Fe-S oxidoreductase